MVTPQRSTTRRRFFATILLVALLPVLLAADGDEQLPIERLDPQTRGRVVLALVGLVLLVPTVVVLVWLGGRMARRYANRKPRIGDADSGKQWYEKPLVPKDDGPSDRPVE